jgi:hypothetical protein
MRLLLALLVAIALTGVVAPAYAADEKPAKKADAKKKSQVKGEITKIDGSAITLKVKDKAAATTKEIVIATDDKTQIMIEGTPSKVADLKVGQRVVVSPAEGTAAKIQVPKAKEKPEKKPAAK